MKRILFTLKWVALLLTLIPPCLRFTGSLETGPMQAWMLAGTVLWFAIAVWPDPVP